MPIRSLRQLGGAPAVFDPQISGADRDAFEAYPGVLIPSSSPASPSRPPVPLRPLVFGVARKHVWLACLAFVVLARAGAARALAPGIEGTLLTGAMYGTAALSAAAGAWHVAQEAAIRRRARHAAIRLHGRYVLPDVDLDADAGRLLERAQAAARSVTASALCSHGLADKARMNAVLDEAVWELARDMAKACVLRRKTKGALLSRDAGPATRAALQPRAAALAQAHAAHRRRVADLEEFAGQVGALDSAYRDLRAAEALQLDEDAVLDLVSGRARDRAARDDIQDLGASLPAARRAIETQVSDLVDGAARLLETIRDDDPSTAEP
jgi:hypothetical protein